MDFLYGGENIDTGLEDINCHNEELKYYLHHKDDILYNSNSEYFKKMKKDLQPLYSKYLSLLKGYEMLSFTERFASNDSTKVIDPYEFICKLKDLPNDKKCNFLYKNKENKEIIDRALDICKNFNGVLKNNFCNSKNKNGTI